MRFNATKAQECDDDDEITTSMPELEQAGNLDEQESDNETTDSREHLGLWPNASPVKSSVPKEVDIARNGDAETSFASDAEGSGEIAAVLGETLDRVAQAIDDMHLEFDRRTPSVEKIDKEIVAECAKEASHEGWPEEQSSNIIQPRQDGKDDCSHDSWNIVSDDSSDAASSD